MGGCAAGGAPCADEEGPGPDPHRALLELVARAGQEGEHRVDLVAGHPGGEAVEVRPVVSEDGGDLPDALGHGPEQLSSSVGGVRTAVQEAGRLQPVDDTGDRTRGETGHRGQPTAGELAVLQQQVEALVVGGPEAEPLRDGVVVQHRGSAVSARDPRQVLMS